MARKQKPPGYENWTWEEIRVGHRLSKAEKRCRRLARHLGGTEDKDGKINPPQGEQKAVYNLVLGGLFLFLIIIAIFAPNGCAAM
jgi:hypothetical protein